MPPARGWKRSRALWDHARRPDLNRKDRFQSWWRAVLYELQPVRFSQLDFHSWHAYFLSAIKSLRKLTSQTLPVMGSVVFSLIKNSTLKQKAAFAVAIAYYYLIRWVHEALSAGPFVLMISALVAIFTIGLGDTAGDGLSAYSVFNRGFQKILGSVDAEALLAQHVAGGGGAGGMMMMAMNNNNNNENENDNNRGQEHPGRARAPNQPQPPAAAEGNREEQPAPARVDPPPRRSGKKARRKDQESRQEMRRQREAAAAMGFGGNEQQDAVAMNRLIEDQAANNNAGAGN